MLDARAEDAVEDRAAALEDPRDPEELLTGLGLELPPQLVGAAQEGHVVGMLEVREADDPGQPVRRAVLVEDVEALQPEDAPAAASEVVERRAPHSPDPDDDDVVALHRT